MTRNSTTQAPVDAEFLGLTEEIRREFPDARIDPMRLRACLGPARPRRLLRRTPAVGRLERSLVHELAHAEISLAQLRAITTLVRDFIGDRHYDEVPPRFTIAAALEEHPEHNPVRGAIAWVHEADRMRRLERSRALFFRRMLNASRELRRLQNARFGKPLAVAAAPALDRAGEAEPVSSPRERQPVRHANRPAPPPRGPRATPPNGKAST